jgi:hypothetical protein
MLDDSQPSSFLQVKEGISTLIKVLQKQKRIYGVKNWKMLQQKFPSLLLLLLLLLQQRTFHLFYPDS